jgi:hypothetical protein
MLKLVDVKAGDILIADGGFTCMRDASEHVVRGDTEESLFIDCDAGEHRLVGQLDDAGNLVGLTKKQAAE